MRQMGGFYIYSFDLTVLFFGVCINLAGIPYSAGFIGKELLLFQVLRDDFLSLFVRGCWMVSFFFTPIYMLMLLFLVLFGPKKSNLNTYFMYWNLKLRDYLLLNYYNFNTPSLVNIQKISNLISYNTNIARFQLTAVTSRLTTYVLITFWSVFFFFGNLLLLVLLNYNTLTETILSSSFTTIKQHAIFSLNTSTMWLSQTIFFYILVLTTFSFIFLLNLRYTFTYNYFYLVYLFDLIILLLITIIWLI